uniref:Uncharacterized protein n=1 Tax=Anopheles epiroticus TaxID=199890 RepID=A0A182PX23_9DIPT
MSIIRVGYDETLTIWNYFSNSPSNEWKLKRLRSKAVAHGTELSGGGVCSHEAGGALDATRIPSNRNKEATYRDLATSFLCKAMH